MLELTIVLIIINSKCTIIITSYTDERKSINKQDNNAIIIKVLHKNKSKQSD